MAKDNTLNKNSLEFNIETGNKDQDKIIGPKAKNIKNSEIHTTIHQKDYQEMYLNLKEENIELRGEIKDLKEKLNCQNNFILIKIFTYI
ncbi:hypothetical protein [Spiroplasma sp. SV19]|uniref:hypothetical protein n=1 Tax=Spiroplasma sp. SV19 TaxID=2570468 RepID=UPI0024B7F119|nr:hypothetical protein [Spiroplasma sp. SV19]WHQ37057.1 hypothetical protein E7Y35_04065 [Spiroplasma sp. SV19]